MRTCRHPALLAAAAILLTGCRTHHEVSTVSEVKPIHITIDVNVKVDKALDDFFSDIDEARAETAQEEKGAQSQ